MCFDTLSYLSNSFVILPCSCQLQFGPIVFTIIMTTRQMFSICLSAIIFGHVIKPVAGLGAMLVFGTLFYQIYGKYKAKMSKGGG